MSKELEALERIKNAPTIYVGCASDIYTRYPFECKIIEKALKDYERRLALAKEYKDVNNVAKRLKALEIIRKHIKIVNGQLIFKGISYKKNIKDYELLKEVLL